MRTLFLVLLFNGTLGISSLSAQERPIKMTPELALSFPFVAVKDGVTVKYPVLINLSTVLYPGAILRCIYLAPANTEAFNLKKAHNADLQKAYSRDTRSEADKEELPKSLSQIINTAKNTVWKVPNNFQLALAQYPLDACHIIYTPTDSNNDLVDQIFSFTDGLLVGLPNQIPTVIAVEDGSRSDAAGLKAGDQIFQIGSTPIRSLEAFTSSYIAEKDAATLKKQTSIPFTVKTLADGQTKIIAMPLPPTFSSFN